MLRILPVIPAMTQEQGGTSACVAGLARYEAEDGHQVTVLTTNQGERKGETPIDLNGAVDVRRLRVLGPDRRAYAPEFRKAVRRQIGKSSGGCDGAQHPRNAPPLQPASLAMEKASLSRPLGPDDPPRQHLLALHFTK